VYFERPKHSLPKLQREEIIASIPRDSQSEKLKTYLRMFSLISRKVYLVVCMCKYGDI